LGLGGSAAGSAGLASFGSGLGGATGVTGGKAVGRYAAAAAGSFPVNSRRKKHENARTNRTSRFYIKERAGSGRGGGGKLMRRTRSS
jgi:hypothetical protein